MSPKYLSVYSIADRYGCHPSSVWRWVAQDKFPRPIKVGGITRWIEAEVEAHERAAADQRHAA